MRASAITLESETTPAERAALTALLKAENFTGKHLEIGTAAGGTLKELMRCYPEGSRPQFVVIDPMTYFPDQRRLVENNLRSAGLDPASVDFRTSKSWPAFQAAERAGEKFSFIFVDGSHKMNHVVEDIAWTRLLEPGGVVAFHDYSPGMPGVRRAVDDFLAKYPNYRREGLADSLMLIRKTRASTVREISLYDRMRAEIINFGHQLAASYRKRRDAGTRNG